MLHVTEGTRCGTPACFLGGIALLVLTALAVAPPAAGAVQGGENVTVYRASNVSFESTGSVEAAIASGTVEPADTVALGDALVVAIESERLAGTMNAINGPTTANFFTALDGDAEFRIVQTNPNPEANRKSALVGRENVTVHRNETTVYVVVETGDLTFRYRRVHRLAEIHGGERFAVQFGFDLPGGWALGTGPSPPVIEFQPRSQLTTDQLPTTATVETTSETPTSARTSSGTPTSKRSSTMTQQAKTTGTEAVQTEVPGVPGFTVLTALVALLALAGLRTRRP
jgi:PGF-CTERM protein